ncbi:hypothetical protein SAMN04488503_3194 [Humidesulfovibrio mexicanus]|uniref:Response regulatory domain-containing protein n=1 Tax=Humidesulfovibrio mexicanus TaxID=147047 RepID=A0A239CN55_9BACT|nr:hypothetical protein [Humidesulfovibrio mexicanus]SNS20924.1 hypothetical protein SAMN04488503_3194 [Humidesulfovibrio mexicanus]
MSILLVTPRGAQLAEFSRALGEASNLPVEALATWEEALARLKGKAHQFLIIDQGLAEGDPLELSKAVLMVNAMVNMAVVSPLGADDFHEASEGLGILAPIPVTPGAADGVALAQVFRRFL